MRIDNDRHIASKISLIAGLVSIFSWIFPFLWALPVVISLYFGEIGKESETRVYSQIGSILSWLSILFSFIRAYLIYIL